MADSFTGYAPRGHADADKKAFITGVTEHEASEKGDVIPYVSENKGALRWPALGVATGLPTGNARLGHSRVGEVAGMHSQVGEFPEHPDRSQLSATCSVGVARPQW